MSRLTAEQLAERIIRMKVAVEEARDPVGAELVEMIRTRVRLGYGCDANGQQKKKFVELKPSTIAAREKMQLFPGSQPKRSHLTMTGDMMDNLTYEKTNEGQVTLLFSSKFAKLKAAWAHEGASKRAKRPFMFLTNSEYKRVLQILKKYLRDYVDSLAR
jgi:hypothetical protein